MIDRETTPDGVGQTTNRSGPLRAGLIAEASLAEEFRATLSRIHEIVLAGVAGMPRGAALADVPWYDDHRVMIAQEGVELLLVAASTRDAVSICEAALTAGVHVWRRAPLGRYFAEAVETAGRIKNAEGKYHVASWWAHAGDAIADAWRAADEEAPVFSEITIDAEGPPLRSWRSSLVDAGGGALINDAYDALESLCAMRGLPESVFGTIGKCRDRASSTPRETEDMASAVLKYDAGGVAVIRVLWDCRPVNTETLHYGVRSGIRYDAGGVTALNLEATSGAAVAFPDDMTEAELRRLARVINAGHDDALAAATLERHLMVSAVLEAIYLSAKTGQPENPRRLFEVQKWPLAAY